MAFWLFKEEPSHFNYADLERHGAATWDGVRNALALQNLRQCKRGDRVFFYQTGPDKMIVGIMAVTRGATKSQAGQLVAVTVRPLRRLNRPVTLKEIRADPTFSGWDLIKFSRLSVMPVPPAIWKRVEELATQPV